MSDYSFLIIRFFRPKKSAKSAHQDIIAKVVQQKLYVLLITCVQLEVHHLHNVLTEVISQRQGELTVTLVRWDITVKTWRR